MIAKTHTFSNIYAVTFIFIGLFVPRRVKMHWTWWTITYQNI